MSIRLLCGKILEQIPVSGFKITDLFNHMDFIGTLVIYSFLLSTLGFVVVEKL